MIYIVEIPHQRLPICWSGTDKAHVICTLSESMPDHTIEGSSENHEYEALLDANRRDLHAMQVFEGQSAAIEAIQDDRWWQGHQGYLARQALRRTLELEGLVPA